MISLLLLYADGDTTSAGPLCGVKVSQINAPLSGVLSGDLGQQRASLHFELHLAAGANFQLTRVLQVQTMVILWPICMKYCRVQISSGCGSAMNRSMSIRAWLTSRLLMRSVSRLWSVPAVNA